MNQDPALGVEFRALSVVVDAVEILDASWVSGWNPGELFFERQPDRHRVDQHRLASEARDEQLGPVLAFDEGTKGVRHLQAALVVDLGGIITAQHGSSLHFVPLISTAIVENVPKVVNANPCSSGGYALFSPAEPQACGGVDPNGSLALDRSSEPSANQGQLRDPACYDCEI